MDFTQFAQFLQLVLQFGRTELLVLIGDALTLPALDEIRQQLMDPPEGAPRFTVMTVKLPFNCPLGGATAYCRDCPVNRLTFAYLSDRHLLLVTETLTASHSGAERLVLMRRHRNHDDELVHLADHFMLHSAVIVEVDDVTGALLVFAWHKCFTAQEVASNFVDRFVGPRAIFDSDRTSAQLFRHEFQRWSGERRRAAATTFLTTMMSPYNFVLYDDASGRQLVASARLVLIQVLGDRLGFEVRPHFLDFALCPMCRVTETVRRYHGRSALLGAMDEFRVNE